MTRNFMKSHDKLSHFNIDEMTKAFREARQKGFQGVGEADWWHAAAVLAQAQQLSVISSRLSEIAETLEAIRGKAEKVCKYRFT